MFFDVRDTGAKLKPGSGIRPTVTNVDLRFHNDNSYNDSPPDYVWRSSWARVRSRNTAGATTMPIRSLRPSSNRCDDRFESHREAGRRCGLLSFGREAFSKARDVEGTLQQSLATAVVIGYFISVRWRRTLLH
jgi:hypothetical protein